MDKTNKKLIILLAILIVVLLGVTSYFIFSKISKSKDDNEININNTNNNMIEEEKEDKVSLKGNMVGYNLLYWNYDEIYKYYFKMNDNDEKFNIDDRYKYVNIINNKLYWNIDNEWIIDKNITDDIIYFNMELGMNGDYFIVVTESNKIYYITLEDSSHRVGLFDINDEVVPLTSVFYELFRYEVIDVNGDITRISTKVYETGCSSLNKYYFEINNKIYVLDGSNLEELKDFMKNRNITGLKNNCYIGNMSKFLKIEHDGKIKDIVAENNKFIDVKHYIFLYKSNNDFYNLVIDKNDNLYIIDKEKNYQQIYDKVNKFEYNTFDFGNEFYIDLQNKEYIFYQYK